MKVTLRYEALNARNESTSKIFDIDAGDFALMIETDRLERASKTGVPVDQVEPRAPQEILDEAWNGEESVAHEAKRGDRGKGKKKCTCGAGCGERRGCRAPSTFPWSLDQMLDIGVDPTTSGISAEDAVIAGDDADRHEAKLQALREARKEVLTERQQLMIRLMFEEKLTAAQIARELGISRAGVKGQLDAAFKKLHAAVVNKTGIVGSGVSGVVSGATSTSQKGK